MASMESARKSIATLSVRPVLLFTNNSTAIAMMLSLLRRPFHRRRLAADAA